MSYDRILAFGALLARGERVVAIVGGSAIEVYTRGGYVSCDIDIRADRSRVERTLAGWVSNTKGDCGFVLIGGSPSTWWGTDTPVIPTGATPHHLDPDGPVQIAVVEDLFVKRRAGGGQALAGSGRPLMRRISGGETTRDSMDVTYLDRQALTYKVDDLLAEIRRKSPPSTRRQP